VVHGFARVVGTNPVVVLAELEKLLSGEVRLLGQPLFDDGRVAARIVDVVASRALLCEAGCLQWAGLRVHSFLVTAPTPHPSASL